MFINEYIIVILLLIIIFYDTIKTSYYEFFNTIQIKSNTDNNEYKVLSDYFDNQAASDLMGELNLFAIKLISKLKETYIDNSYDSQTSNINEKQYERGRLITKRLMNNFKSSNLKENEPESPDKTSFTKDKSIIALCLRAKYTENNNLHDKELLKFVFLHELAHMGTIELNHSQTFWTNFKFLLDFAKHNNLYVSQDFDKFPSKYCSTNITYNPTNDKNLASYFT